MENNLEVTELLKGRPNHEISSKESECYDLLDDLGIEYERVEYNRMPENPEEWAIVDEILQVKGIKNLVLKNKSGSQYFFVIINREARLDTKEFRSNHSLPKIEMAKGPDLEELLNTHAGAVSIMELPNDKENKIKLFIEESILNQEYFRFHPNENCATVRIKMDDFKNKLIPYLKHEIIVL